MKLSRDKVRISMIRKKMTIDELAKTYGCYTLATIPEDHTALTGQVDSLKEDLGNVEDIVGKKINGIFNGNNYTSSLVLEAGITYHILYGSGSAANLIWYATK